jgi:crotonobetainyl-CoA:carnitine CoA-transferase CaiB-like acyl-CoA transferase
VNHPNRYDGQVPELVTKGLKLGEHTREILAEHGYPPEKIADLLARKIVTAPDPSAEIPAALSVKIPAE